MGTGVQACINTYTAHDGFNQKRYSIIELGNATGASRDASNAGFYLLYPVSAGSKGVYVVVDPMNEIVESDEKDNVKPIPEELESNSPVLDLAREVVGKTALPFAVIVLTIALLGVVYLVGKGRRDEVNKRLAEQSSLVSVLADEFDN